MKTYGILLLLAFLYLIPVNTQAQCTAAQAPTAIAAITPTTVFQTITIQGGQYTTFTAIAGRRYVFSFCQGGGTATFDTEITIRSSGGAVLYGYNNNACGNLSHVIFTAPAAGTYRVLVNLATCATNTTNATLAYREFISDEPCNAYFISAKCSTTPFETYNNTGATNTALAVPACASGYNYNGGDLWFSTQVPYTGSIIITTDVGTVTDMAMVVYRANTSCSSLVSLGCNDNGGPGDMPQVSLTGLTPGDTLLIRIWDKNNNTFGTFNIKVYDPDPDYCFNGSAKQIFPSRCIEMTPNLNGQSSSMWNSTQINLASAFDYNFDLSFGNSDGGADGITFTFHNNPAGLAAVGSAGSSLGVGGVANSVSVEFDTFNNGGGSEIAADHTAIFFNGNTTSPATTPVQASSTSADIEDGAYHNVRVTWNPGSMTLSVYFDGVFRTSYTGDIVNNVLGGSNLAYWGFTSSTGQFTNQQIACPNNLPGAPMPVEWASYHLVADNQQVVNFWSTANETNAYEFVVERSYNGTDFTAIGTVAASGNTSAKTDYEFIDFEPQPGTSYYRLKQIDIDGQYSYSVVRSVQFRYAETTHLKIYPNPTQASKTVSIDYYNSNTSGSATLVLYDELGREIVRNEVVNGNNQIQLPDNLTTGIYQITVRSDSDVMIEKLSVE